MRNFVLSASVIALATGSALAAKPQPKYLDKLAETAQINTGAGSAVPYGTGFEAGEGFALGAMPQGGWTTLAALVPGLSPGGTISNVLPAAGSQHLRNVKNGGNGSYNGDCYPAAAGTGQTITTIKTYIPSAAFADYYVFGMRSDAYFAWGIHFNYLGVVTREFGYGTATQCANIVYGQYVDLVVDYNNGNMSVTYNGVGVYSGPTGFTVNTYDYLWIGSDNYQLTGEGGNFDNVGLQVPAPGAAGLLGLGAIAGLRRRR